MLVRGRLADGLGTPNRPGSSLFDKVNCAVEGGADSIPFNASAVSGTSPLEEELGVTVADTGALGSKPMPSYTIVGGFPNFQP
jgi:hypothetical protein